MRVRQQPLDHLVRPTRTPIRQLPQPAPTPKIHDARSAGDRTIPSNLPTTSERLVGSTRQHHRECGRLAELAGRSRFRGKFGACRPAFPDAGLDLETDTKLLSRAPTDDQRAAD